MSWESYRRSEWCPVRQSLVPYVLDGQSYRLAVYEWGDLQNERVVFCVHGVYQTGLSFQYIAAYLAPHYRVISVDMPGRGASDDLPVSLHDLASYRQILQSLITQWALRQYDYIGTSMGGLLVFPWLAEPEAYGVRRAIINDIGPVFPIGVLDFLRHYLGFLLQPWPSLEAIWHAQQALPMGTYLRRPEVQAFCRHYYTDFFSSTSSETGEAVWRARLSSLLSPQLPPPEQTRLPGLWGSWSDYARLRTPFLLMHGSDSQLLTDPIVQQMRRQQSRYCFYMRVEGGVHPLFLCTEEECSAIAEFLLA